VNLKEFAATALANVLADRVQLGSKPTVIAAPPSQVADYPTIAVWIEKSTEDMSMAYPIIENSNGVPILGALATGEDGEILDGSTLEIAPGVTVTSVGTLRCSGRVWVGSRYVGKREEVEWAITYAFNQDDAAPGRLMVDLNGYRLGEHTINFGFAAADLGDTSWTGEHAFESRLWSWRQFTIDCPLVVKRTDPITKTLILEFSQELSKVIEQPADVAKLTDLEKYIHDDTGNLVTTTL
jgi:hypothetical protein